ncbi:MAG: pilus assembly PilX family protein [Thermodesulfobacteriota bacterium]
MNIKLDKALKNQEGIAIILAMIMLLVMSVMAVTVSFISNVDFKMMAVHKRDQEAFLAAESCIAEGRKRLEEFGPSVLYLKLQSVVDPTTLTTASELLVLKPLKSSDTSSDPDDWKGPLCRSGPRIWDSTTQGLARLIEVPNPVKKSGRPTTLTSLGGGGITAIPVSFNVMGKTSADEDKSDTDAKINTGTEVGAGFEVFIVGEPDPVYSAQ